MNKKIIDCGKLKESLHLLDDQLYLAGSPSVELIVCGGSALIATGLVARTTCDIDVLALMDSRKMIDSDQCRNIF